MHHFILNCWNNFQKIKQLPYVVPNSIPILWFGDLNAYSSSDLRVRHCGIKPVEYGISPQKRINKLRCYSSLPKAASLVGKSYLSPTDIQIYEDSMNDYFVNNLNGKSTWYRTWFSNNEAALHGLDASYFDSVNYKRIAIHIDLQTPVATNKWSSLTNNQKQVLQDNVGYSFSQLLNHLDPHVIITSMNRDYIKNNFTDNNNNPCAEKNAPFNYQKKDAKGRTYTYIRAFCLNSGRYLIWGNNGNTPFARLNQNQDIISQIQNIRNLMQIP